MIYTRRIRIGEFEETFEGAAEEITQIMKTVDTRKLHEAAAKIKPARCIIINANGTDVDIEEIVKKVVESVEEQLAEEFSAEA